MATHTSRLRLRGESAPPRPTSERAPRSETLPSPPTMPEESENETDVPRTKSGAPDRRFRGQRDLPQEEIANPNYRRAARGGVAADGTRLTMNGKPDRRFLENRTISPEEAEIRGAEEILAKYKQTQH